MNNNIMNNGSFFWFQGVVEDRRDPLKLGRVRVRVFGLHTKDKTFIPTEDLPWSFVLQSPDSASISGIGNSISGLVEGSWVMGFFRDGNACQQPVILGTISGIPEEAANNTFGFYDPRTPEELKKYPRKNDEDSAQPFPREENPLSNILHEPDVNRLARNENINDTIVQKKIDERIKNIQTSMGLGGEWDEPNTRYDAVYPFNHVSESESGHIHEIDDTPNAERIHRYHRKGSFDEYYPDGSKVEKIVKNNYEIVLEDNHIYVRGVCNLTVDGNINILSNSSIHVEAKKNILVYAHQDLDIRVDGSMNAQVSGDVDLFVENGDLAVSAPNASLEVSGAVVVYSSGDTELHQKGNLEIKTEGSVLHTVAGSYQLHVQGEVDIRGNPIHLNKDKG